MKMIGVLVFAGLLPVAAMAQPASRIAGVWTGHMGQNDSPRSQLTIDIKYDGKEMTGTVTGPPSPGEVKNGTFDELTGALKFEVHVPDGDGLIVRLEGVAAQGTAMGRVAFRDQTGYFKLTKGEGDSATYKPAFTELSATITKAAGLAPPDKYNYRPVETVRTFAQMVAHIADGNNFYCGRASGVTVQWTDAVEKGALDKAAVLQKLKSSMDGCAAAYQRGSGAGMLLGNLSHLNQHYGNMVTYLRMMGLTPPSN